MKSFTEANEQKFKNLEEEIYKNELAAAAAPKVFFTAFAKNDSKATEVIPFQSVVVFSCCPSPSPTELLGRCWCVSVVWWINIAGCKVLRRRKWEYRYR